MPTTVRGPLKIISFSANGIWKQAYQVRKQLHGLKIDEALFSDTHLKPHVRFYIPNYNIYQTEHQDGDKRGTVTAVKKDIPRACVILPLLLSVEAPGICIPIANSEMLLATVYKSPQTL
jgi:hypothetical protein